MSQAATKVFVGRVQWVRHVLSAVFRRYKSELRLIGAATGLVEWKVLVGEIQLQRRAEFVDAVLLLLELLLFKLLDGIFNWIQEVLLIKLLHLGVFVERGFFSTELRLARSLAVSRRLLLLALGVVVVGDFGDELLLLFLIHFLDGISDYLLQALYLLVNFSEKDVFLSVFLHLADLLFYFGHPQILLLFLLFLQALLLSFVVCLHLQPGFLFLVLRLEFFQLAYDLFLVAVSLFEIFHEVVEVGFHFLVVGEQLGHFFLFVCQLKYVGSLLVDTLQMGCLFLFFLFGLALRLEKELSALYVLFFFELLDGLVDFLVPHFGGVDSVLLFLVDVLCRQEVGPGQVDRCGSVLFLEVIHELLAEDVDDVVPHVSLLELDLVVVVSEEVVAVFLFEVQFLFALVVFEFFAVVFELVAGLKFFLILVVVLLIQVAVKHLQVIAFCLAQHFLQFFVPLVRSQLV